ncbi:MAG: hypothetical protein HRU21_05250, partial [Pseudomonadales bacterium]|nr:hypothetical protein [Pseudomonadales bacterium]
NAQVLIDQGAPQTVARQIDGGGGLFSRAEDALTSIPIVGDMINNRRREGLEGLNRRMFDLAGEDIGFTTNNIGREGVTELIGNRSDGIYDGAVGKYYDDTLKGQNFPADSKLQDTADSMRAIANTNLPPTQQEAALKVIENEIDFPISQGFMTGDQFSESLRRLKTDRSNASGQSAFYADMLGQGIDGLEDFVNRQGGQQVTSRLANANSAYRKSRTLQDATDRAKGDSGGAGVRVATPSQFQAAIQSSDRRYGGVNPMSRLADTAQEVMPSGINDSGTARRAIVGSLLGAGSLGADFAANYGEEDKTFGMTQGGLTAAGLLTLFGTKQGQKRLAQIAFERPDTARMVGNAIGRSALFGRGGAQIARDEDRRLFR